MPRIHYITDLGLNWQRRRHGSGFKFTTLDGKALTIDDVERIKALVIPPAWNEVKICPDPCGHIQAVGYDAKGRKQYIYHPDWILHNQQHKFDKMVRFGEVLPTLRETISGHMRQHDLTRERILATVVWLLEHTFIRVGNSEYAKTNHSYGLTTLREKHVKVEGNTVKFSFKGKSGIFHELGIRHPRVAKTIKECIELPGYNLFQYVSENGERQLIDSRDVNEYLQAITGEELSAKDFRTWGGTTLAGDRLYNLGPAETPTALKQALVDTVKEVSSHLRNTVAVCRKYYIHPTIFETYEANELIPHFKRVYSRELPESTALTAEEYAAWSLLRNKAKSAKK